MCSEPRVCGRKGWKCTRVEVMEDGHAGLPQRMETALSRLERQQRQLLWGTFRRTSGPEEAPWGTSRLF